MGAFNPAVDDRNDQYYEELLGAAAFGTLTAAEAMDLEPWLARSAAGRAELAEFRMIAAGFGLLVPEATPSSALRDRIEAAAMADVAWANPARATLRRPGEANEANDDILPLAAEPVAKRPTPLWRPYLLAAAAALVLAVFAGVVLDRLVFMDDGAEREAITYELTPPIPDLSVELSYDPDDQFFILQTENMPPAPANSVYQVWLIDANGPEPVGVMDQSRFVVPAPRDAYDAFAITVEPGPLGSTAPTTEPFFVAQLRDEPTES